MASYVSNMVSPEGGLVGNLMRGVAQGHATQVARHKARIDRAEIALKQQALNLERDKARLDQIAQARRIAAQKQMQQERLTQQADIEYTKLAQGAMEFEEQSKRAEVGLAIRMGELNQDRVDSRATADFRRQQSEENAEYRREKLELEERKSVEDQMHNLRTEQWQAENAKALTQQRESSARLSDARAKMMGAGLGTRGGSGLSAGNMRAVPAILGGYVAGDKTSLQHFTDPPRGGKNQTWMSRRAVGKAFERLVELDVAEVRTLWADPEFSGGQPWNETKIVNDTIQNLMRSAPEGTIVDGAIEEDKFAEYVNSLRNR